MRLLLCLALLSASAHADLQHYTLRVAPSLTGYSAHACFPDSVPERLITGSGRALALMRDIRARFGGVTRELTPRHGALLLPRVPDDRCLDWAVDLGDLADGTDWNSATRIGDALVVSPRLLLWRQAEPYRSGDLELRFELPPGVEVSAPWRRVSAPGAAPVFRLGATAPSWPATLLLGRFERREFEVGGARFELALTAAPARIEAARVQRWVEQGARAVAGVIGRFPVERVQLLVVPVHDAHEAVPDAVTARGGGAAIHAKLHAGASDAALRRDWVIVHELAHFLLPFVDRRDAWLSEGFASYYQHVLRARSGALTPEAGWRALLDGLARGDRGTRPGITLRDAAHAPGANTMRIYWSGAALALHADVELRRRSGGRESLDTVLARFVACCREPDRSWRATELLGELDRLSGTTLFSTWHAEHIHSAFFPNLRPLYAELGIAGTPDAPRFGTAVLSGIREELMRPRAAASVTR
jgi:hypothetical protein